MCGKGRFMKSGFSSNSWRHDSTLVCFQDQKNPKLTENASFIVSTKFLLYQKKPR